MKQMKSIRTNLLLVFLLVLLFGLNVSAAAPKKVTGLKATVSTTTITLKWNKVSGAKGYDVCKVDKATGKILSTKTTTKNSIQLKKCSYGTTYYFKVCAYNKSKVRGEYSSLVHITPVPPAPSNFKVSSVGNLSITLTWDKVAGATGYIIEGKISGAKDFTVMKTTKSATTTKATFTDLKKNKTYVFRIRSYVTGKEGAITGKTSSTIQQTARSYRAETLSIHKPYYIAKVKAATTCTNLETNKTINLKKNQVIYLLSCNASVSKGYLKNGTQIRISTSKVKFTGLDVGLDNDYSTAAKEEFVRMQGLTSRTNHLIWISETKTRINIFVQSNGSWKLEKCFKCSVGTWDSRTASGTRRILKSVYYGPYDGPCLYFSPGVKKGGTSDEPQGCAFHNDCGGPMGKAISHGCVRVQRENLVWMYYNCPVGTTVFIY